MARPTPRVAVAMDGQAAIAEARRRCLPMLEAALGSGSWDAMCEAKAIASSLNTPRIQARRLTAQLDAIACPDGRRGVTHGRAA